MKFLLVTIIIFLIILIILNFISMKMRKPIFISNHKIIDLLYNKIFDRKQKYKGTFIWLGLPLIILRLPSDKIFKSYWDWENTYRHEKIHWVQMKELSPLVFAFLYWFYSIKYGYQKNPFELDARYWETNPEFLEQRPYKYFKLLISK